MAEKVVLNQKDIDAAKAKKAEAAATVAKAKADASAKSAATLAAKQAQLDALKGRIDYKTGTSNVKPIDYAGLDVLGAATDTARKDMAKALTDAQLAEAAAADITIPEAKYASNNNQSAYDLLYEQFSQYGLGSLVEGIKDLITSDISPSELTLRLRQTDAYKKRFSANAARIEKGLTALNEAEYLGMEDKYQEVMRQYGLPESYYARGELGVQEGFTKLLANDVSNVELEDRIMTAQDRVLKANPEVTKALKEFYPDINNGDILAYSLDPQNAIKNIQRKVTAAEIGGAAMAQGLATGAARAEELAGYGVDKAKAQQGFQSVAAIAPRGGQLAAIYGQEPYGQLQAEQEVFDLGGASESRKRREKLSALEQASFSASTGAAQSALGRERAMGQGQF